MEATIRAFERKMMKLNQLNELNGRGGERERVRAGTTGEKYPSLSRALYAVRARQDQ